MRAKSKHRKSMKAETSRQVPQKLTMRLKLVLLSSIRGGNRCYYCFPQMLTLTERTMRQEKGELTNCRNNKAQHLSSRTCCYPQRKKCWAAAVHVSC